MSKIKTKIISVSVYHGDDNPVFGESVTIVSVDDEAAGPFIKISQLDPNGESGELRFDLEDLKEVYKQAKMLMSQFDDEEIE